MFLTLNQICPNTPNLQTQEGMVIHMLKPFFYKESHRVLWKYDVTLIST